MSRVPKLDGLSRAEPPAIPNPSTTARYPLDEPHSFMARDDAPNLCRFCGNRRTNASHVQEPAGAGTGHVLRPATPDPDAARRLETIRHEWRYVRRYVENTGGPTLKIHLARLEGALATPEPPAEPVTGTELHRSHRIFVSDYVVTDHPVSAADLLNHAALILNECARVGALGQRDLRDETARWFGGYDDLARR